MNAEELPTIDPNTDFEKILPIHQKRTIAFINHFIMNTVSFLNAFAQSCESRLMDFEYKMQKVEASLLILESQLASIPGLEGGKAATASEEAQVPLSVDLPEVVAEEKTSDCVVEEKQGPESGGVPACKDGRFVKFFKMLQFGVQAQAVKLKMQIEGVDPDILDKPDVVVPGSVIVDNLTNSTSSSES